MQIPVSKMNMVHVDKSTKKPLREYYNPQGI